MFSQIKGLLQFLPRTEDSWVSLQLKYEKYGTVNESFERAYTIHYLFLYRLR